MFDEENRVSRDGERYVGTDGMMNERRGRNNNAFNAFCARVIISKTFYLCAASRTIITFSPLELPLPLSPRTPPPPLSLRAPHCFTPASAAAAHIACGHRARRRSNSRRQSVVALGVVGSNNGRRGGEWALWFAAHSLRHYRDTHAHAPHLARLHCCMRGILRCPIACACARMTSSRMRSPRHRLFLRYRVAAGSGSASARMAC